MVRPRLFRRVGFQPYVTYFKPAGVRLVGLVETVITVDEFEALRLKDFLGIEQEEAAKKMNISQPTFHRLLSSARKKVADAVVNGKAIRIEGGSYKMVQQPMQSGFGKGRGTGMGAGMGTGRGAGRARAGRGFGGFPSVCVCSKCGHQQPKQRGIPCTQMKCEKCGAVMIRG